MKQSNFKELLAFPKLKVYVGKGPPDPAYPKLDLFHIPCRALIDFRKFARAGRAGLGAESPKTSRDPKSEQAYRTFVRMVAHTLCHLARAPSPLPYKVGVRKVGVHKVGGTRFWCVNLMREDDKSIEFQDFLVLHRRAHPKTPK